MVEDSDWQQRAMLRVDATAGVVRLDGGSGKRRKVWLLWQRLVWGVVLLAPAYLSVAIVNGLRKSMDPDPA